MLEINLNMYHAVALAAVLYYLGTKLCEKVPLFNRYCIPAPLVGGVCFAALNTILYATGVAYISFDATLQTVFMNIFFTTVGFTVSLPLLKKGGKAVLLCLLLGCVLTVMQNVVGCGIMGAFGRDPRLGLLVGSVPLIGGPGTAASYGALMDGMGITGSSVIGLAAATFGLVSGSVMGGPIARMRIERHNLECLNKGASEAEGEEDSFTSSNGNFVTGFMMLMLALGIGDWVGSQLTALTGLTFPGYIGAMVVAAVVRNVVDAMGVHFPEQEIDVVGNMSLNLFLSMALAGLKLWQLVDLALPMIVTLAVQVVLMFLFAYFAVFNIMGRDYDAAVMTAGFIGFSMGATSNAMANMQVVTKKYGPSPISFFA
ncbi:MAG: sodium:glutamate symporter, partial [Oscillospiraceae bacterium]|nr:sodium:glutamate symporter [Oscillospiraceae bacterium]